MQRLLLLLFRNPLFIAYMYESLIDPGSSWQNYIILHKILQELTGIDQLISVSLKQNKLSDYLSAYSFSSSFYWPSLLSYIYFFRSKHVY